MAIFNSYVKLPEGSTGWCRLILPLCEKYKDDQKKQKKHHHHLHARYFLIFLKKIKMALSFIDPSLWGLKFAHTHTYMSTELGASSMFRWPIELFQDTPIHHIILNHIESSLARDSKLQCPVVDSLVATDRSSQKVAGHCRATGRL